MTTDNSNGLARVTPSAIIPRTIDEVARLAKMAAASGLAKTTSPEAAGMLICAGLEIGLTPMTVSGVAGISVDQVLGAIFDAVRADRAAEKAAAVEAARGEDEPVWTP